MVGETESIKARGGGGDTTEGGQKQNNGMKIEEVHDVHRQGGILLFKMPVHYPRYTKLDYETMPEWKLDCLLNQYGFPPLPTGDVNNKRNFAIGAFLWC